MLSFIYTNMEVNKRIRVTQNFPRQLKIVVIFLFLFSAYHAAEYMIVFKNNVSGFFLFQSLFFILALLFGNWYSGNGLTAWGLPISKNSLNNFVTGICFGFCIYATSYFIALATGVEKIVKIPVLSEVIKTGIPFAFGVFFSSLSEDVLTRGLLYSHFKNKLRSGYLVVFSSTIYLLNHIYRLNDGPAALLYLFLLGVVFILPVIYTKKLWLTAGIHWAGNTFFYFSHSVIQTEETGKLISPNYLFSICLLFFILMFLILTKRPGRVNPQ
jgi:uncharacterized protein